MTENKEDSETDQWHSWLQSNFVLRTIFPIPLLPPVTNTTFPATLKRLLGWKEDDMVEMPKDGSLGPPTYMWESAKSPAEPERSLDFRFGLDID